MTVPVPTLCRLEYLGANGWTVGHAGISLLDPQKYVDKLARLARATVLDDRLQPTGTVYQPDGAELL